MTWVATLLSVLASILRCKPCMIGLGACLLATSSYWVGHHKMALECRDTQLAAQLANKQADLDNANKAAADANTRANEIEVNASDQRKEDADYIAQLKSRPACDLTDDDIGGLPNHRNRNGARPPRSAK